MSIASEISRLQTAKADIKAAIEAKGVTVPSSAKLDDYDTYVGQISGGGPTPTPTSDADDVIFIDYDGTILHRYTFAEVLELTAMPSNPSHGGDPWSTLRHRATLHHQRRGDENLFYRRRFNRPCLHSLLEPDGGEWCHD